MLKEIRKLVIGAVLTLSGAIMMTSEETIAVVGMVIGIIGVAFFFWFLCFPALSVLLITKRMMAQSRNRSTIQSDN